MPDKCKILSIFVGPIFVNISDKPRVYNGRAYFLNIFYAPNITKLGFFYLGPILLSL